MKCKFLFMFSLKKIAHKGLKNLTVLSFIPGMVWNRWISRTESPGQDWRRPTSPVSLLAAANGQPGKEEGHWEDCQLDIKLMSFEINSLAPGWNCEILWCHFKRFFIQFWFYLHNRFLIGFGNVWILIIFALYFPHWMLNYDGSFSSDNGMVLFCTDH